MKAVTPCRCRSIFLSDMHLGSNAAKTEFVADFLRYHEAEHIYLVGDIVDGWRLRRTFSIVPWTHVRKNAPQLQPALSDQRQVA